MKKEHILSKVGFNLFCDVKLSKSEIDFHYSQEKYMWKNGHPVAYMSWPSALSY